MRITSAGNVGIGVTSPSGANLVIDTESNGGTGIRLIGKSANDGSKIDFYADNNSTRLGYIECNSTSTTFYSETNVPVRFFQNGGEAFRVDTSKRLLVGTSSGSGNNLLQVQGESGSSAGIGGIVLRRGLAPSLLVSGSIMGRIDFGPNDGGVGASIVGEGDAQQGTSDYPSRLVFSTTADGASSPTERMRIDRNGDTLFGTTVHQASASSGSGGHFISSPGSFAAFARSSGNCVYVNRISDDGDLIEFRQDGTAEGTISVSGTTVSYNGAHLSRWSQILGIDPYNKAVRPEILRGTVMSNLDEMCDWTCPESGECQDNEQLNKTKISDVEGDKNVAGIFQSWDDDDDTWVNDYYLAMTGDFVIRIAAGTTVERGDLLMSAGDGTAKPQDDDIIRSKTIAKVTSTNVSCTYDDGSYCVPCVLMAC
jgi:hypothetical protein